MDLSPLTGAFCGLTVAIRVASDVEEWQVGREEADELFRLLGNVARWYDYGLTQKAVDHAALMLFVSGAAGARVISYRVRTAKEREARGTVTDFPGRRNFTVHEPAQPAPPVINPDFTAPVPDDDSAA